MSAEHEKYMRHCLEAAARACAFVAPNPMVGSCIVIDKTIISSGIHEKYGAPHAEVNAIRGASRSDFTRATLYVTLEPCSHFGKTPPCVDAIIAAQIPRVVSATQDPNPRVAGNGFEKLRGHGVEVIENILRDEARFLNRRFFSAHQKKRPYVILKWAETADGFIAREDFSSKWISSEQSRTLVHQWRSEEQAILVGTRTALHDDPELTVRAVPGTNPLRVVLDPHGTLPPTRKLWGNEAPTLCVTGTPRAPYGNEEVLLISNQIPLFPQVLEALHARGINSLIVEGGAHTLQQIIDAGTWDESRVFRSPARFIRGIAAPRLPTASTVPHELLKDYAENSADDLLHIQYNPDLVTLFK